MSSADTKGSACEMPALGHRDSCIGTEIPNDCDLATRRRFNFSFATMVRRVPARPNRLPDTSSIPMGCDSLTMREGAPRRGMAVGIGQASAAETWSQAAFTAAAYCVTAARDWKMPTIAWMKPAPMPRRPPQTNDIHDCPSNANNPPSGAP